MALPVAPASLSPEDEVALSELYRRGTPANTLRAWERDLIYLTAATLPERNNRDGTRVKPRAPKATVHAF